MTDKNRKWKQPHQNPGQRASQGILRRTMVITLLVALAFVPLIWTLFQLMILDHDKYEQMAIANQTRSTSLSAERGVIYDRNMNILAKSVTVENVFIDPNQIATEQQNLNLIATGLAEILDMEEPDVLELARKKTYFTYVKKRWRRLLKTRSWNFWMKITSAAVCS